MVFSREVVVFFRKVVVFSTEEREALNDVILPFHEETVLSNFLIREVVVSFSEEMS